jgi:uncharacterized alpha-E superfamily protein
MAMLSRVAENLYWMSRNLERAENTARLINVNGSLLLDLPRHVRPGWSNLIAITGSGPLFYETYPEATELNVVKFLIADEDYTGSILSSIRHARENARSMRDIIPREAWEQINELFLTASRDLDLGLSPKRRFDYLHRIILAVQLISGILDGGMSHDAGYEFMRLGINLERADMTTRIVDVRSSTLHESGGEAMKTFENILWMSVLKSLTAYQMYRRHMQSAVKRGAVLRFLLHNDEFPRSFRFCVSEMADALRQLPRNEAPLASLPPLVARLASVEPEDIKPEDLPIHIDDLQIQLYQVHDAIQATYFQSEDATASK